MFSKDAFKLIKYFLILKLLVLLGFFFNETEIIKFGEANILAQVSSKDKDVETVNEYYEEKKIPEIYELFDIKTATESETKKSLSRYLDLIEKRKQETEQRMNLLNNRETQLKKMEDVIDRKIIDLEEERRYIVQTLQKEKKIKSDRMRKLKTLYEKMEPKKAAPVFEQIDKDLAVALFQNLKQKQITAILEKMNPDKATELTEYFGRIKSGAEYDVLKEMNKSLIDAFDNCKGGEETNRQAKEPKK